MLHLPVSMMEYNVQMSKKQKQRSKSKKKQQKQAIYYESQSQDQVQVPKRILRKQEPLKVQNPAKIKANFKNQPIGKSKKSNEQVLSENSFNHNFQGHAVVTVRRMFDFKLHSITRESQRVAHLMWDTFKKSNLISKKNLNIMFGAADINSQNYQKMLEQCGFEQLLRFQQGVVREAQDTLRFMFVQQMSEQRLRESLTTVRRIRNSEQFLAYFMELVQQLRNGPLLKFRINEKVVKKIQAKIETKQEQQDESPVQ